MMPRTAAGAVAAARPLCVDLDGTLVATDLLWECFVAVLRSRPGMLLLAPLWLLRGRAYLKRRLAEHARIDFTTLPYRPDVLAFVQREFCRGRTVVLATAADQAIATGISEHLGLFSDVLASDGATNLKGRAKAALLALRYGKGNFDYLGDSPADVACWQLAAEAISSNHHPHRRIPHLKVLPRPNETTSLARSLVSALRPHQWLKNLLVFVPAIGAHDFSPSTAVLSVAAFVSLSLCASGGYVLNDLLDVGADRQHPRKRLRPFAAGHLALPTGIALVVLTWSAGFALAAVVLPPAFVAISAIYLAGTSAYSIRLKKEPVLDVMFLAGLYVIRLVAGGAATGIPISTWLLAFTLFLCLSLAFLKRFIEVSAHDPSHRVAVPGRGYLSDDGAWLHSVGISSAYLAAVVLAMYVTSADVSALYTHPEHLLLICPLILYWATRTWLMAHRGKLHDDPVVAVALDPATYVLAAISAAIVLSAV